MTATSTAVNELLLKYGRLTPLARLPYDKTKKNRGARLFCKCDCGNTIIVMRQSLIRGTTRSCGCLYKETRTLPRTHGQTGTKLYDLWKSMIDRCRPSSATRKRYYDRGIGVCKRWSNVKLFIKDMEPTFKPGLELERINNNKGYSPKNCKWATRVEQNNNRSDNVIITFNKQSKTIAEWARFTGLKYSTIRFRYRTGKPPHLILNTEILSQVCKH